MIYEKKGNVEEIIGGPHGGITKLVDGEVVEQVGGRMPTQKDIEKARKYGMKHSGIYTKNDKRKKGNNTIITGDQVGGDIHVSRNNHVRGNISNMVMNGKSISVESDCGTSIVNNIIHVGDEIIDTNELPYDKIKIRYKNGQLTINGKSKSEFGSKSYSKTRTKSGEVKTSTETSVEFDGAEMWNNFKKWWREN